MKSITSNHCKPNLINIVMVVLLLTISLGSGSSTNASSNYPLVQLRGSDNQQIRWLSPDPTKLFSNTSFTSQPVSDFPSGLALVTAFVNGIPSISKFILISTPPPTPTQPPIHPLYLQLVSGG